MASKHFNKDLDNYVTKKRSGYDEKSKLNLKMSFGREKEEAVPNLSPKKVHVIKKKPGIFSGLFSNKKDDYLDQLEQQEKDKVKLNYMKGQKQLSEREIQAIMKEQEKIERRRESSLSRMLKNLKLFKREEQKMVEMAAEEREIIEHDPNPELVSALKISTKWLGKLSSEEKKAFKASPDYNQFKSICEKHGLTKK